MKLLVCLVAACFVAASAYPDGQLKLAPDDVVNAIEEAVEELSTTSEAPEVVETPTEKVESESTEATEASIPKKHKNFRGTVTDRTNLANDLFKGYNKDINPDNVDIEFGINLMSFNVIESQNLFEGNIWISQTWRDERLAWNPEKYNGLNAMSFDSDKLWKPDIALYNSANLVDMLNCWKTNVVIYSSGKVSHIPPCKMVSICPLLSLRKEPYGEVTCPFKFGSWTYDGNSVDLHFYKNQTKMDLSELKNSSGFDIVDNVAERNVRHYDCCAEPYVDLTYNVTIKRMQSEELFKLL